MLTLFRRDLKMHQMRRKQSLAWRNWSGRTIQSNKHWAVAVIVPAVRFGGSNQKPNLNIDLANTKRGQYQTKKKKFRGKGVHVRVKIVTTFLFCVTRLRWDLGK